jgi:hypothetical protein
VKKERLFIAGVPASGKTHLGRWLENEHNFIHIDFERDNRLVEHGLKPSWDHLLATGAIGTFSYLVASIEQPIIFNWGFPPRCLPVVRNLARCGFALWWLNGDWAAARRAFEARNDCLPESEQISSECFDVQQRAIGQAWQEIASVFGGNIIDVVSADGSRKSPEEIFAMVCSTE